MNQHRGGKWLIHGTKHHKDNQLQSLQLPCKISLLRIQTSHKGTIVQIMYFRRNFSVIKTAKKHIYVCVYVYKQAHKQWTSLHHCYTFTWKYGYETYDIVRNTDHHKIKRTLPHSDTSVLRINIWNIYSLVEVAEHWHEYLLQLAIPQ